MGEGGGIVVIAVHSVSGSYDQLPKMEPLEGMLGTLLMGGPVRVSFPWRGLALEQYIRVQLGTVERVLSLASEVPNMYA